MPDPIVEPQEDSNPIPAPPGFQQTTWDLLPDFPQGTLNLNVPTAATSLESVEQTIQTAQQFLSNQLMAIGTYGDLRKPVRSVKKASDNSLDEAYKKLMGVLPQNIKDSPGWKEASEIFFLEHKNSASEVRRVGQMLESTQRDLKNYQEALTKRDKRVNILETEIVKLQQTHVSAEVLGASFQEMYQACGIDGPKISSTAEFRKGLDFLWNLLAGRNENNLVP